jgi:UTP-glucose-1-phosphate uridylyltransferase
VEALQSGDAAQLGALMVEAQAHFDRCAMPACPGELTAPVLHRVLSYEPLKPHVWGGKGVGSQGDGSAQFVARSKSDQQAVVDILERDLGMPCIQVTLSSRSLSRGDRPRDRRAVPVIAAEDLPLVVHEAPPVRKAVIPAAGLGTRLFPATKATKKELFPVIDRDGIAKPAILLIVEEALQAGIQDIVIIVQQADLDSFQMFFDGHAAGGDPDRLPPHLQMYAQRIEEMGSYVSFVIQHVQQGFGHAVYSARKAIGSEPFLLMLGDHIYHSSGSRSCVQQLLDAYQEYGMSVLGLRRVPEPDVVLYGTATGAWLVEQRLLNVAQFVEKPPVDYARTHLRVSGLPKDEYLAFFGQYVIKPQVFDYLEEQIDDDEREQGEFQLTSALDRLRQEEGFLGLLMEGQCFDIGLPETYLHTLQEFRR